MANRPMQAMLVNGGAARSDTATVRLSLVDSSGAQRVVPQQAAAQTDVPTLTSAAAAGATPTKAEFDKTVADLAAIRTVVNSLLAKQRTAEQIAP